MEWTYSHIFLNIELNNYTIVSDNKYYDILKWFHKRNFHVTKMWPEIYSAMGILKC